MSEDSERKDDGPGEFPDFVSVASDDEQASDESGRSFLKYKTKTKKNFKAPKLVGLTQQMMKVGQTLQDKKNRKLKQQSDSLSTPSELICAPSDFEHVFHALKTQSALLKEKERNKKEQERKEQERKEQEQKEQELLFRIFRQCKIKDSIIPIYTVDECSIPRIVNMPLSRLNQINKTFFDSKSLKTVTSKGIKTMTIPKSVPKRMDHLFKSTKQIPKLKNITAKAIIQQPKDLKKLKKDVKK